MTRSRDSRLASQALIALVLANARYWPTVAPVVHGQLRHWETRARTIANPDLRRLALAKLHSEGFNAEAAAVAATLAPRAHRRHAIEAIVALELLFDYLDGLTERPLSDPLADGERLYGTFIAAIDPDATLIEDEDHRYLVELALAVRRAVAQLPARATIAEAARSCVALGAQAQVRMHAASTLGTAQLSEWARVRAGEDTLAWREHLAGAASSVLALHALIAAAADPRTTAVQAERLAGAYLSIATVVTLLDGLIDHARDTRNAELSYTALYETPQLLAQALSRTAREASARSMKLPSGAHHLMTLAGAIAYWATAPEAGNDLARPVLASLRGELRMLVLPPMLVMRAWRGAKWAHRGWRAMTGKASTAVPCPR